MTILQSIDTALNDLFQEYDLITKSQAHSAAILAEPSVETEDQEQPLLDPSADIELQPLNTPVKQALTLVYTLLHEQPQDAGALSSLSPEDLLNYIHQALLAVERHLNDAAAKDKEKADRILNTLITAYVNANTAYAEAVYQSFNSSSLKTLDASDTATWPGYLTQLLGYELQLIRIMRRHAINEEQRIERDLLFTSIQIRIAKAIQLKLDQERGNATALRDNDNILKTFQEKRLKQLAYQKGGQTFAAFYGLGQGAYCAGFTIVLIGLNYFLNNALVAALGWPSLLLIVVALPLFLSTASNYWVMRKDLAIMAMQAYDYFNPDPNAEHQLAQKNTIVNKKSLRYIWAITAAVLGGILISTLTAFGIYNLMPEATAIGMACTFFLITAVPEIVLNINHNIKFWKSPWKHIQDAYHDLGPWYFAQLSFWFLASLIGMVFTALALTSLGDLVGVPFEVSFPILSLITISNISFYFNRAYEHVARQRDIAQGIKPTTIRSEQLTWGFTAIRISNAFSNALVAVIGFMATANYAKWITIHGEADLALSNIGTLLNFSSSAVILCLTLAVVVGGLTFATSYIANAAGKQTGFEAILENDLIFMNMSAHELNPAPVKLEKTLSHTKDVVVAPQKSEPAPRLFTHWYRKDDCTRYQNDLRDIAGIPHPTEPIKISV